MKIITLSEEEFTEFASHHKYSNYYQTVEYAKVMTQEGYDYHLLGFTNNNNDLVGAVMILSKTAFFSYKIAYAPYGFLIDFSDYDFVEELTLEFKKLLTKQKFIYFKMNPNISCSERDKDGNIISYNPEINDILEILQKNNYIHTGFNQYFENEKPRFLAVLKLTASNDKLYQNLSKQTKNKISKANRLGIEIYEGQHEDLDILYEFIKRKQKKSIKHYKNLCNAFGNDAKIYLAKINTQKFLMQSKDFYEKELDINETLNQKLQEFSRTRKNITNIINKKMESDQHLALYQKNLVYATNLFSKYPEGLTIGGCLVIQYQKKVHLIIEGFHKKYRDFNPNYLLKWELIKKFNQEGFHYFNLNGIVGEFKEKNNAVEYIGEFLLITNPTIYPIYQRKLQTKKEKKANN